MQESQDKNVPLFLETISAGFPAPGDEDVKENIDLNKLLVKNRIATFFLRVSGDSMEGGGIYDGDILVVDRSVEPMNGKIVIASINGELTVKKLKKDKNGIFLEALNPKYKMIKITEYLDFRIWGVVTSNIHFH
jgi:DNA polymerase V